MSFSALSPTGAVHGFHDGATLSVCGLHSLEDGFPLKIVTDKDGSRPAFPPNDGFICRKCVRHYMKCKSCIFDNPFWNPSAAW